MNTPVRSVVAVTTTTSGGSTNSTGAVTQPREVEGVLSAPLDLSSSPPGSAGASLTLEHGQTYALQAGLRVMYRGQPYRGTTLYPGERVHVTLQKGIVTSIALQSSVAWETYESSSGTTTNLAFDGGAMFTAPLSPNAVLRSTPGFTTAAAISWPMGTLVRVEWNVDGQIVAMFVRSQPGTSGPENGQHAGPNQGTPGGPPTGNPPSHAPSHPSSNGTLPGRGRGHGQQSAQGHGH
jgi:hypothetical protein